MPRDSPSCGSARFARIGGYWRVRTSVSKNLHFRPPLSRIYCAPADGDSRRPALPISLPWMLRYSSRILPVQMRRELRNSPCRSARCDTANRAAIRRGVSFPMHAGEINSIYHLGSPLNTTTDILLSCFLDLRVNKYVAYVNSQRST